MSDPTSSAQTLASLRSVFGAAPVSLSPAIVLTVVYVLLLIVIRRTHRATGIGTFKELGLYCIIRVVAMGLRIGVSESSTFDQGLYTGASICLSIGYVILIHAILSLEKNHLRALFPASFARPPLSFAHIGLTILVVAFVGISIAGTILQIDDMLSADHQDRATGLDKTLRWIGAIGMVLIVVGPIIGSTLVGMIKSKASASGDGLRRAWVIIGFAVLLLIRIAFAIVQIVHPTNSEAVLLCLTLIPETLIVLAFLLPSVYLLWSKQQVFSSQDFPLQQANPGYPIHPSSYPVGSRV